MEIYEYMRMKLIDFPAHVQQQYNLHAHAKNGYVYLKIRRSIYGLPQAGKLANKYQRDKLLPHVYYEVSHTSGLWKHISQPIDFYLVMDDFGVKYIGEDNARHLIDSLKRRLHHFRRLDGRIILRNQTQMGLRQADIRYIHARVYSKKIAKVQTYAPPQTSICPLSYRPL